MRYERFTIFGLLACVTAKLQSVDEAGFRNHLANNDRTLAAYILSGDESLKDFEEEWAAVQSSKGQDTVVSVDCSTNHGLCHEFDVASFPAIRLHRRDGQTLRYRGRRKEKEITAYLRRMSRPVISHLDSKNASSFTSVDEVVVVAHVDAGNEGLGQRFAEAANQYHDRYSFAIRQRRAHGVSLVCTNNANFEQSSITDLSDPLTIDNFIKQCARPLVPEFTRRSELEFSKMGKSIVHYFTSSDEERESYTSAVRSLAKRYKEYLLFVTTDVQEYPDILSLIGHAPGSSNVLSVVNPINGGVYPFGGKEVTSDTIEEFLKNVSSGKVKSWDGTLPQEEIKHEEL